ncbi:MAG: carbamoyltransferase HypF [Bacteroidota bacterium]
MQGWHLHIEGQVQGVGFRPFVYNLALQHQLKGWVSNTHDGLHIRVAGTKDQLEPFVEHILQHPPKLAKIYSHTLKEVDEAPDEAFYIRESQSKGAATVLLTSDASVCPDCIKELENPTDPRYQYPFITCTNCGPRYSIMEGLPYDRPLTSMQSFEMCPSCSEEYHLPSDRRYWSQTNSCGTCGVRQYLWDKSKRLIASNDSEILDRIIQAWKTGQIVAIKGIGGYLLTCDATNPKVVQLLRDRKGRPTKPFALMYTSLSAVAEHVDLTEIATASLEYPEATIVLLPANNLAYKDLAMPEITAGLDQLGVMVAYTPLFRLLLKRFARPIIATSGNVSGAPIQFQDNPAIQLLSQVADLVLANDRRILVPQDDSVVRFSPKAQQRIVLRRSRGLAPNYVGDDPFPTTDDSILATGGQLKSSFAMRSNGQLYLSQYLGDLDHFDTQQSYRHTLHHFSQMIGFTPKVILSDQHPTYYTSGYAQNKAIENQWDHFQIQHHEAHFCAILGEHQLFQSSKPVLGVIWDGTGLGNDQQIWGSEFFLFEEKHIQHVGHFGYFPWIFGDKMAREPRLSALSIGFDLPEACGILQSKFTSTEWKVYQQKLTKTTISLEGKKQLRTSSMGRLFDAVASLLDLKHKQSFEGEAAMLLEQIARQYMIQNDWPILTPYKVTNAHGSPCPKRLFKAILKDVQIQKEIGLIAARFHMTLVAQIKVKAKREQVDQIAFSGGVFQNALLVDLLIEYLSADFKLYFHELLSPNDENIAFGQLMWYQWQQELKGLTRNTSKYVFSNTR